MNLSTLLNESVSTAPQINVTAVKVQGLQSKPIESKYPFHHLLTKVTLNKVLKMR